jgi:hypothetical protein
MTLAEVRANDDAEKIERLEGAMLELPQVECPVEHIFGPGLYIRQGVIKAGTLVVGHRHKQAHTNILLRGVMMLATEDGVRRVEAPMVWIAPPGRKVFLVLEDILLQNLYPTELTDPDAIEERFIEKSETWKAHDDEVQARLVSGIAQALEPAKCG